jgi:hypothetical protein
MTNEIPSCPICGTALSVTLARGRKSGKPFVMLKCPRDGRHFRGFTSHRPFVEQFLNNLEATQQSAQGSK